MSQFRQHYDILLTMHVLDDSVVHRLRRYPLGPVGAPVDVVHGGGALQGEGGAKGGRLGGAFAGLGKIVYRSLRYLNCSIFIDEKQIITEDKDDGCLTMREKQKASGQSMSDHLQLFPNNNIWHPFLVHVTHTDIQQRIKARLRLSFLS